MVTVSWFSVVVYFLLIGSGIVRIIMDAVSFFKPKWVALDGGDAKALHDEMAIAVKDKNNEDIDKAAREIWDKYQKIYFGKVLGDVSCFAALCRVSYKDLREWRKNKGKGVILERF